MMILLKKLIFSESLKKLDKHKEIYKYIRMIKNSIVIKSLQEFEDIKTVMAEDAQINGKTIYFSDSVPEDFPCLVKISSMEDIDVEVNLDETEPEDDFGSITYFDSDSDIEEDDDSMFLESFGTFYDFWFLSKKEVQQLLES